MSVIVILALVAAFLALRLYSVLGKRTGHEQQPAAQPLEKASKPAVLQPRRAEAGQVEQVGNGETHYEPAAEQGIRQIVQGDRSFDVNQFIGGAKSAYGMILEAFWKGDKSALADLADEDVAQAFADAIDARNSEGHVLDNRLVSIEEAVITDASVEGRVAHITLRFKADIAAVTRDRDGMVVAGSLTDAIPTVDIWTFSRELGSRDPNWKLTETDEGA